MLSPLRHVWNDNVMARKILWVCWNFFLFCFVFLHTEYRNFFCVRENKQNMTPEPLEVWVNPRDDEESELQKYCLYDDAMAPRMCIFISFFFRF